MKNTSKSDTHRGSHEQPTIAHHPSGSASAGDALSPSTKMLGRYQITKVLGHGGMATVYLAHDPKLDRQVAIKVPFFDEDEQSFVIDRFRREAKAVAGLHHPNICPIYDVGQVDDVYYMTMAYVEGQPLSRYIRKDKPQPIRTVLQLVRRIAIALEAAHQHGVIHRDLKPANIMINRQGEPVIMDFGLARREGVAETQLTRVGTLIGTPQYMPPEQISGNNESVDRTCDIYSLGVVLYGLLTARLPFQSDDLLALLTKIAVEDPQLPSEFRRKVDPTLDAICLKAMAKNPEERYQSAQEFAEALKHYLRDETGHSLPVAKPLEVSAGNEGGIESPSSHFLSVTQADLPSIVDAPSPSVVIRNRNSAGRRKTLLTTLAMGGVGIAILAILSTKVAVSWLFEEGWLASSPSGLQRARAGAVPTHSVDDEGTKDATNLSATSYRRSSLVESGRRTFPKLTIPDPLKPAADISRPVKVFILAGQSNASGRGAIEKIDTSLEGGRFSYLKNADDSWKVRRDVWIHTHDNHRGTTRTGDLTVGFGENPNEIGPSLGLGQILGEQFQQQVLIIQVTRGPLALALEGRPPSSGGERGFFYDALVEQINTALANLSINFPDYRDQGFEIAGLVWFQGWNDSLDDRNSSEYPTNLANLIRDLRRSLDAPQMKVAIAEFGMHGANLDHLSPETRKRVDAFRNGQRSVAELPEFRDTTRFVPIANFVPREPQYMFLYGGNPHTLLKIGEACGEAMIELTAE